MCFGLYLKSSITFCSIQHQLLQNLVAVLVKICTVGLSKHFDGKQILFANEAKNKLFCNGEPELSF